VQRRLNRLNDDALLAYARFGVEAGVPNPATALKSLRAAGFSCSKERMDWAWQQAVTIPTVTIPIGVHLPGRHPWAVNPPQRLVILDGAPRVEPLEGATVVVVARIPGRFPSYSGEPEVNS
jgi:hypothetical protein